MPQANFYTGFPMTAQQIITTEISLVKPQGGKDPVPWVPDYRRWYDGIPYQVKQRAGDRGITTENMEKSQHTDFNEDTTNESASVAVKAGQKE